VNYSAAFGLEEFAFRIIANSEARRLAVMALFKQSNVDVGDELLDANILLAIV
jgi:hypothetical protein